MKWHDVPVQPDTGAPPRPTARTNPDREQGRRRASRRLVFLLVIMTLGPLAIMDIAALRLADDAARGQAKDQVAAAAAASAVAVEQELRGLGDVVESFAGRPSLRGALADGRAGSIDLEAVRFHLGELRRSRTGVDLTFLADASGRLVEVLPATPSIIGVDFSYRDWYRGVTATRGPYVSEVYETRAAGGGLVVAAAAPIRSASGDGGPPVAILVAGYRIQTIQEFVDDFAAAQGVALTVTDQRGVVVASPGVEPTEKVSRRDDAGVAAALEGRSGTAEVRRSGQSVLSAHSPVRDAGWTVIADLPSKVALEEVGALRAAILAVTGALALIVVAGLFLLDRALRRRAAAEEELRRSQAFLDSVVENIPNMVFVKDAAELRFVRFNRAGEELLGSSRRELLGRNDHDLFPPEQAESSLAADRQVLDGGELVDIHAEPVQTKSQGERILHTRKIPILAPDGTPQYLLGISEDITESRLAEAAVEEARRAADRANRAKSHFLSRMSHELRTPLNAVLGFGQLLQLDGLEPEQKESVDHIVKAGAHLLELIDEVLDIARVESGQLRLSMEPVSVCDVLTEGIGMVRPLAAARGVTLVEDFSRCSNAHVRADRQRLRQVMVNLLANAVKYNRDGGTVTVSCDPSGDGTLRLVVVDTGIGMAEHDLARLFQPFERLGAENSDVEGTGLGLALTKQLVEVMGGVIGVISRVGVGSSFSVELPLVEAPVALAAEAVTERRPAANADHASRTVLYVEDNLSNVKLVERVVSRRPEVQLMVAMLGGLALELAREHRPSLILLDLHLPDMSGEEVLRRLRADPRTAATPVVVLSADATAGQVQRLRADGAADYLTKPFDIPRLLELIDGNALPRPDATPAAPALSQDPLAADTVAALRDLAGESGGAGVRDAVSTFLEEGASRLADLGVAVRDADAVAAERLAHSLAGSSATFGAQLVAGQCRRLEATARSGDLHDAPSLLAQVQRSFGEAVTALREEFLDDGEPAR